MTVFLVVSRDASSELQSAIDKAFPGKTYRFNDRTWLVSARGTAQEICDQLGIKKGGIGGTFVMPASGSYYGVANSSLWEWLRVAIEEGDDG